MQEPMDVCYLCSVRGLRTILKGGWGHNICCSAAPWSHGVCLSVTQVCALVVLSPCSNTWSCTSPSKMSLLIHGVQPWGQRLWVPRHVTCCLHNWGASWRVGIWGRGILQNAVASHFPQAECSCMTKAEVHHTRGSKIRASQEGTLPPIFFALKKYERIIN